MDYQIATHREREIPPAAVRALYRQEGWWPERSEDDLAAVIGIGPAVGAWQDDRLVGFARAVSDGHFRAYVEDVVVDKSCRGSGCGAALIDALHVELAGIDVVSLFCHEDLAGFYRRVGYRFTSQRIAHRSGSDPTGAIDLSDETPRTP
jgi:ribosomal protein S18 acetylase RimI-like enzyme